MTNRSAFGSLVDVAVSPCRRMKAIWRPSGDHAGDVSSNGAGRQDLGLLRRDVEEIEVGALAAQVAVDVRLEVVAVDDDRLGGLGRVVLRSSLVVLGRDRRIGVVDDEDEALAVGRPGVVGDAALDVGELDRFPAGAIEQPDLRAPSRPGATRRTTGTCRPGSSADATRCRAWRSAGSARVPSQLTIQTSVSFLSVSRIARVTV